jgi:hypothetical protein
MVGGAITFMLKATEGVSTQPVLVRIESAKLYVPVAADVGIVTLIGDAGRVVFDTAEKPAIALGVVAERLY